MKIGDVVKVVGPAYSKYLNKFGTVASIRREFIGVDFEDVRNIQYIFIGDLIRGVPQSSNSSQPPWKK